MKQGDRVRVSVKLIPPFDTFNEDWIAWVKSLDGQYVVLDYPDKMESSTLDGAWDGWYVEDGDCAMYIAKWLPLTWITQSDFLGFCDSCGGFRKHRLKCPVS